MNNWKYSTYSQVDPQVRENFPFEKPRKDQLETISEIKHAIDRGYKYIVLEAGTGTGKSVMAATLSLMFDSTYILTVTKQLQDQYLKDFNSLGFKVVKGRGNFRCRKYAEENIKNACDEGRCVLEGYRCEYSIKRRSPSQINQANTCEYEYQKWRALTSKVVISNYHYLFLELNYNQDFNKRKFLVCDEAHNLEDSLMSQLKLEFKRSELKDYVGINLSADTIKMLNNGDYQDWIDFIGKVNFKYKKELDKIKDIKDRPELAEKVSFLKKRIDDCNRFISHIKRDPTNWIFDYDSYYGIAEFKPIKVDNYAVHNLFKYADTCLFMSATILDYKLFAKWLGISEDEIYPIRRKSPFDVARNPIITEFGFNMSYPKLPQSAPKSLSAVKEILKTHKDEKGLIHTVSHQCKNYLKKNLNDSRLIDHKTYNRARQLNKFKKSKKPLVLISPSMNEGVDLPGRLCRFQIIYKIPYPSISDKQTNLRKKVENEWYDYKTCLSLVQTYGRGMRYENDYCRTYFLDSRLKGYIKQDERTNNFLPDFFKEAIDITPAVIDKTVEDYDEPNIDEISMREDFKTPNTKMPSKKKSKFNKDYFTNLAKEVSKMPGFISDRDLIKIKENEFIPIDNLTDVSQKAKLKEKGKQLEKDDKDAAVDFYDELKGHRLFINDYYPYRRQCILFKNKLKDNERDWKTVEELFKSKIYLNPHQFVWLENKINELKKKLDLTPHDINVMDDLVESYKLNKEKYRPLQNTPVPIAERIVTDDDGTVKLISEQKYDASQDLFYVKELGVGYIRQKKYEKAMEYYMNLLENDLLYYKYHAYKQFARIYREMKNPEEFERLYLKYKR